MSVINPNKFADESLGKAYVKTRINKKQNGHQTRLHVCMTRKNRLNVKREKWKKISLPRKLDLGQKPKFCASARYSVWGFSLNFQALLIYTGVLL